MKRIICWLTVLLFGSALFVSCIDEPSTDKYVMTVNVTKGEDVKTRALWIDDSGQTNELKTKWVAGEKVIVYDGTKKLGELTALASETASTVLSGELVSAPSEGSMLLFFLHGDEFNYTGQDGTLSTIGSDYDYAVGMTQDYTVSGKTISVANGISLRSMQAIVKFTLVEAKGATPIKPKSLIIDDGENKICQSVDPIDLLTAMYLRELGPSIVLGDLTINCSGTVNEVYVSLLFFDVYFMSTELPTHTITLTANDGTSTYTYTTKTVVTILPGNYYEITVKMAQPQSS